MSHFTVMVVTKGGLDNAESELERLLEPYNENTEVAPYWRGLPEDAVVSMVDCHI